jgi:hypothetical protein
MLFNYDTAQFLRKSDCKCTNYIQALGDAFNELMALEFLMKTITCL